MSEVILVGGVTGNSGHGKYFFRVGFSRLILYLFILFRWSNYSRLERKFSNVFTITIYQSSLKWCVFRGQIKLEPRPDWSPLGVQFKISVKHPCPFHMVVSLPGPTLSIQPDIYAFMVIAGGIK